LSKHAEECGKSIRIAGQDWRRVSHFDPELCGNAQAGTDLHEPDVSADCSKTERAAGLAPADQAKTGVMIRRDKPGGSLRSFETAS
jgi:hypothetical protein